MATTTSSRSRNTKPQPPPLLAEEEPFQEEEEPSPQHQQRLHRITSYEEEVEVDAVVVGATADDDDDDDINNATAVMILRRQQQQQQQQQSSSSRASMCGGMMAQMNPNQLMAMISNFSTSYNIVNISLVLPILEQLHPQYTSRDAASTASSLLAGMILGQLVGGALGDTVWLGRLGALKLVMGLQIVASVGSALIVDNSQIFVWLALWRFLLGVGAGGVYPLAAVLSAEQTTTTSTSRTTPQQDGEGEEEAVDGEEPANIGSGGGGTNNMKQVQNVVLTFSMQGVGFITVPILALLLLYTTTSQNLTWRFLLGFGSIPGIVLFVLQRRLYPTAISSSLNTTSSRRRIGRGGGGGLRRQRHELLPTTEEEPIIEMDHVHTAEEEQDQQQEEEEEEEEKEDEEINEMCDNPNKGHPSITTVTAPATSNVSGYKDDPLSTTTAWTSPPSQQRRRQEEGTDAVVVGDANYANETSRVAFSTTTTHSSSSSTWQLIYQQEPNLIGKLLGTAGTWFLFDVLFYGNTIFQPIVVEAAFGGGSGASSANDGYDDDDESSSSLQLLRKTAFDSFVLTTIALPGYAVAGYMMSESSSSTSSGGGGGRSRRGSTLRSLLPSSFFNIIICRCRSRLLEPQTPRFVMLQGFLAMSILYFVIGMNWSYLRHYPFVLVVLYGLTFFFSNYGPNTTTFILPSLTFSPQYRSTLNGISAACGKLGALVGATLFQPAATELGDNYVMILCSIISIVAYILTQCFVPKSPPLPPPPTTTTTATSLSFQRGPQPHTEYASAAAASTSADNEEDNIDNDRRDNREIV